MLAYIGPGPGLAVGGPVLATLVGILAALLALLTLPVRWFFRRAKPRQPALARRVVVLGLDGLEPTTLERLLGEGRLPQLQSLHYQRLATTCPPLSPVAWSTFATGVHPGRHGIFDFIHRDRHDRPYLSFSQVVEGKPRFLRKSKSFWQVLGEHGVFSHILRVPVSWPCQPFFGLQLAAMGTPDLRGTQGTYTLFSSRQRALAHGQLVRWQASGNGLRARLEGPPGEQLEVRLEGRQLVLPGHTVELEPGRSTAWLTVRFRKCTGLARFTLLPENDLYMTPLQLDPARPAAPVSWPASFAPALARLHGPFATCGLAEDTGACVDEVLSQEAFLEQVYTIEQERERQFFHCLERTSEGLCLAVFDAPDRVQHVVNDQALVDALYVHLDAVVGQTLSRLTADDLLLVLSDHGCGPWRRSFDLNAWLIERGYLVMAGETPDRDQSRAYGLGLSGLYLLGPAEGLREELLAVVDPETGESPLLDVFESSSLYHGPYRDKAPDLVLAYRPGYRTSRTSAQGQAGQTVFSSNTSAWQTDHCFHPEHVPGVLLANRELAGGAHLVDLASTILEALGVPRPDYLEGKSLCV